MATARCLCAFGASTRDWLVKLRGARARERAPAPQPPANCPARAKSAHAAIDRICTPMAAASTPDRFVHTTRALGAKAPRIGQAPADALHCAFLRRVGAIRTPSPHVARRRAENCPKVNSAARAPLTTAPERVLDAPGVADDYYLQVLDWGARNVLAVALGPAVYLWNGADGGSVRELLSLDATARPGPVCSLAWTRDGASLGVGTPDSAVEVWDASRGSRTRTIRIAADDASGRVGTLAWHRTLIAAGTRSGAIQLHDARAARSLVAVLAAASADAIDGAAEVCGLAFAPDGLQLAAGANDNGVRIWDVSSLSAGSACHNPRPMHTLTGHTAAVKALAWCPSRRGLLASGGGSSDRTVRTWDTLDGEAVDVLSVGAQVAGIVWRSQGMRSAEHFSLAVAAGSALTLCTTDASGRALTIAGNVPDAHDGRMLRAVRSPDGRSLATIGADECIKFWPIPAPPNTKSAKNHAAASACLSPRSPTARPSPFSMRRRPVR